MSFLSLVSLQPLKHGCLNCTVQRQTYNYPNVRDFSNSLWEDINFGITEGLFPEKTLNLRQCGACWHLCWAGGFVMKQHCPVGWKGAKAIPPPMALSLALPVKLGIVKEQLWVSPHFTHQWSFGLPACCRLRGSFPSVCNLRKGRVFSAALPFLGQPHCHCHPSLRYLRVWPPTPRSFLQSWGGGSVALLSSGIMLLSQQPSSDKPPSGVTGEGKQQILLLSGVRNTVTG